jgi:hypothetical protein
MTREFHAGRRATADAATGTARANTVGKRTLVETLPPSAVIQRQPVADQTHDSDAVQAAAARGTSGAAGPLPHVDRIQRLFGRHDVRGVRAYVGGSAAEGAAAMGAPAFATGDQVAFASAPDLHTAAHEAAHVVQQRGGVQLAGGVGQAGDSHEHHANAVADLVVAGQSAESLLDRVAGTGGAGRAVQRYTIEDGNRISANRELAMADAADQKAFYARPAAIDRSNAILAAMQSKVQLVVGGAAPVGGMRTVMPVNRDEREPLFDCNECIDVADRVTNSGQSHAIYQPDGGPKQLRRQSAYDIPSLNQLIDVLTRTPDVTPQAVVTGQQALEPDDDAEALDFTYGDTVISTSGAATASNQLKAKLPNRNLRVALLVKTFKDQYEQMPQVQQDIMDHLAPLFEVITIKATEDKDEAEVDDWVNVIQAAIGDLQRSKSGAYRDMDPEERSTRSAGLGVNEHARPEVGESYGVLGTRDRTPQDQGKWSFHFAAVIARDDGDSVTLENYNRMKGSEGDDEWYFDMQGPRAQSFHDKHKDTVADGVTLRMGVPATPEQRQAILDDLERMKIAPGDLGPRIEQAETRAELAALYADALNTPSGIYWRVLSKLISDTGGDRERLLHILGALTAEQRVTLAVIYNGDLERGDQALGTEWRPSKAIKQKTIDLVVELSRGGIGPNPDDWGGEGPGPNGRWGRNHPLGQDPRGDVF